MKPWIENAQRAVERCDAAEHFDEIADAMDLETQPYSPTEIAILTRFFISANQLDLAKLLLQRLPVDDWSEDHVQLAKQLGIEVASAQSAASPSTVEPPHAPLRLAMISVSDSGGAGTAAYRLHTGLRALGVDSRMYVAIKKRNDPTVRVLPPHSGGSETIASWENDEEAIVWKQALQRFRENLAPYPNRPQGLETFTDARSTARIDLMREIREADVLNFHWIAGIIDYPTFAPLLEEIPSVWTMHDIHAFTGGCHYSVGCMNYRQRCGTCPALGSNREEDLSRQSWLMKQEVYSRVKLHAVSPSKWLQNEALSSSLFGQFTVHCIPNGFPLDVFKPGDREGLQKRIGVTLEEKVILFGADSVSNLRKGFQLLINALPHLDSLLPPGQRVALVTFGRQSPDLKLPPRFRQISLGSIEEESAIADVYGAADLFVIPSLEDNLPNTVVESLACGTPVVGFSIGGIPDMVTHQQTGYLAKPFEVNDLAKGISWVLSRQSSEIQSMRILCRDVAEQRYAQAIQAQAYLDLFQSICR